MDARRGNRWLKNDPKDGKVYRIGTADDLMEMVKREDIMMLMPHPRTKNNAGYPDGFKDKDYFKDAHFQGIGFRWGMGLDLSERRLCEYRCLTLQDDMLELVCGRSRSAQVSSCDFRSSETNIWRRNLLDRPRQLFKDKHSAQSEGSESGDQNPHARRLLRDIRRGFDSVILVGGNRQQTNHCRRRGVDFPSGFRGSGVG